MNKNTIVAFLLIFIAIYFFTSPFYYQKILKRPHPTYNQRVIQKEIEKESKDDKKTEIKKELVAPTVTKGDENKKEQSIEEQKTFDTVTVQTDKLIVKISEKGARLISVKTKEYEVSNGKENGQDKNNDQYDQYIEIIQNQEVGGANLVINNKSYDQKYFSYIGEKREISVSGNDKVTIQFVHKQGGNEEDIIKEFTFHGNEYKIGCSVESDDLDGKGVTLGWFGGIRESEEGTKSVQYDKRQVHLYDGKNVNHITMKNEGKEDYTGYYKWVGFSSKYFLVSLIPDDIKDADIVVEAYDMKSEGSDSKKDENINYRLYSKRFASGDKESYSIYTGPSKLTELKKYDNDLEKTLFKGYRWFFGADKWFPAVCEFVLWLLIKIQTVVKDYGIVIILLTIMLKVVTYPLTRSSTQSMNKMKEIQPKINKLREQYKNNPQIMNQKLMEFYRKEGINPFASAGGCLPMILQTPIMISLFVVLRKAIELRGQGTFLVPWISDLSQKEVLFKLPFNLSIPFYGETVALLPILMAVLMYFQNKATIKDPNQRAMVFMMPVIMLVMFNQFPAGLSLYFVFSSALQLLQQKLSEKKSK